MIPYIFITLAAMIAVYVICRIIPTQKIREINQSIIAEENKIQQHILELNTEQAQAEGELGALLSQQNEVSKSIELLQDQAKQSADSLYTLALEAASANFDQSIEKLRLEYEKSKAEYEESYSQLLEDCATEMNETIDEKRIELDSLNTQITDIKKTFEAAREAKKRESLINQTPENFTINLSNADLADIKKLFILKNDLNNPRVLLMLIWTSFIKKPLDNLTDKTFGKIDCGIYKLTNVQTSEVYIGQSVQLHERMRQHFKCGLGIDASNNKLYQNMQEYGVWNFSIELLEECSRNQLDEKEKFYIDLYKADTSLNSTKGNN